MESPSAKYLRGGALRLCKCLPEVNLEAYQPRCAFVIASKHTNEMIHAKEKTDLSIIVESLNSMLACAFADARPTRASSTQILLDPLCRIISSASIFPTALIKLQNGLKFSILCLIEPVCVCLRGTLLVGMLTDRHPKI